jgi:hypothetical protein
VPERLVGHKSHILKVMFLVTSARPCYNDTGKFTFDGKIGIWPFVEIVAARRALVCRPAGTIETKPVNVTTQKYREFMIAKVLPAIKLNGLIRTVELSSNKMVHHCTSIEMTQRLQSRRWQGIGRYNCSPSPPTNLQLQTFLILPFFRALQSAQWHHAFATKILWLDRPSDPSLRQFFPTEDQFWFPHNAFLSS